MTNATATKERPILFSAPMVRAIIEGRKTMTRRLVKNLATAWSFTEGDPSVGDYLKCPYGKLGDRLWVRETWCKWLGDTEIIYKSDCESQSIAGKFTWKPSIHMNRAYSRILLEITDVRVEKLQDISEDDARAEGVEPMSFPDLWQSIHSEESWKSNPWVWAVSFKVLEVKS
jgi:hypothetical protein